MKDYIEYNCLKYSKDFKICYGPVIHGNFLKKIVFHPDTSAISDNSFPGTIAVKEIDFPDKLVYIGKNAFQGCVKLEKINFPNSINIIMDCAFKDCRSLKEISLKNTDVKILTESVFENCYNLEQIELPDSLTQIKRKAFYECKNLKKIKMPLSVEYIGSYSFARTGVETIVLPSNLKECGEFYKISNIKKILYIDTDPKLIKMLAECLTELAMGYPEFKEIEFRKATLEEIIDMYSFKEANKHLKQTEIEK